MAQSTLEWSAAIAEPEQHDDWQQFHANALRDALRKANVRRKETLTASTQSDWREAVYREMRADVWYEMPDEQPANNARDISGMSVIRRNGHGTFPKMRAAAESGAV